MVSTADCQKYLQNWFESNKQNLKKDFSVNPDPKPKTWKRRGKAKVGDSTFRTFDDDSASVYRMPNDVVVLEEKDGQIVSMQWLSIEESVRMGITYKFWNGNTMTFKDLQ